MWRHQFLGDAKTQDLTSVHSWRIKMSVYFGVFRKCYTPNETLYAFLSSVRCPLPSVLFYCPVIAVGVICLRLYLGRIAKARQYLPCA